MKKLILSLAAAGSVTLLSGCVGLPVTDVGLTVSGTSYVDGPYLAYPQAYPQAQRQRRDRDGDGVPNRHDRRPNNPYRY